MRSSRLRNCRSAQFVEFTAELDDVGMFLAEQFLLYRQSAPQQRLRLLIPALGGIDVREPEQAGREFGVVGAEPALRERERALKQPLRVGMPALFQLEIRQASEWLG